MTYATRNALAIAIAMFAASAVCAGSESSNLQVSAEIVSNCTISTTDMNFGAYDPIGANAEEPLNSTATVTVQCTLGSEVTVLLDNGQLTEQTGNGSSGPLDRKLAFLDEEMHYELYADAGRAQVWGAANKSDFFQLEGTGYPQTMTVYGTIPAGQNLSVGNYSDVVTATVVFF